MTIFEAVNYLHHAEITAAYANLPSQDTQFSQHVFLWNPLYYFTECQLRKHVLILNQIRWTLFKIFKPCNSKAVIHFVSAFLSPEVQCQCNMIFWEYKLANRNPNHNKLFSSLLAATFQTFWLLLKWQFTSFKNVCGCISQNTYKI